MLEVGTFNTTHLEDESGLSAIKMRDLGSTMRYTMVFGVISGLDGVGS